LATVSRRVKKQKKQQQKPTLIDNSTLAALAQCTARTAVINVMGFKSSEESAALLCGKAVHAGIEVFLRGGTIDSALERFAQMYQEWSDNNLAPGNPREYSNVAKILGRWLEENPLDRLPYVVQPDKIEIYFTVPLNDPTDSCDVCGGAHEGGEFMLTGLIDAIVTSKDGRLFFPLDHKTTASFNQDFIKKFRNDSQISGYSYALSYLTGQPVTGALINVIEIKRLPTDPKRKCKERGVRYEECGILHAKYQFFSPDRSAAQVESWRRTALRLAHEYRDLFELLKGNAAADLTDRERFEIVQQLPTEGEFNGGCVFCSLFDWCSTGRIPAMAEATLRWDPWITEEGLTEAKKKKEGLNEQTGSTQANLRGVGARRGAFRKPAAQST